MPPAKKKRAAATEPDCYPNLPGDHDMEPVGDWYDDGDESTPPGNEYRNTVCSKCGHTVIEGRQVEVE